MPMWFMRAPANVTVLLWQLSQGALVTMWPGGLPIAVTPLWQAAQPPVTPAWMACGLVAAGLIAVAVAMAGLAATAALGETVVAAAAALVAGPDTTAAGATAVAAVVAAAAGLVTTAVAVAAGCLLYTSPSPRD